MDGPNIRGPVTSRGINLIGDTSDASGFQSNDLLDTNILLAPLMDNAGISPTHVIQGDGPAVDAADCTDMEGNIVETDQRGVVRGQLSVVSGQSSVATDNGQRTTDNGQCDIGAFEYDGNDYPPTAVDDFVSTTESPVAIDMLDNDMDVNGDELIVIGITEPENGTITVEGIGGLSDIDPDVGLGESPVLIYTPNEGFFGMDSFTYIISDGKETSEASVFVTSRADELPIVRDDEVLTPVNKRVTIDVLDNDRDPEGEPLTVTDVALPSDGSAVVSGGTVIYTPDKDFVGTDRFMYRVTDGVKTGKAYVTVTVGDASQCHSADYNPPDYEIGLSELLRVIQLYTKEFYGCGDSQTEDGFDLKIQNPKFGTVISISDENSFTDDFIFDLYDEDDLNTLETFSFDEGLNTVEGYAFVVDSDIIEADTYDEDGNLCTPHDSDYKPQDWRITLSELLRVIQLYNSPGYHPDPDTEDGFAPGK